MYFQWQGDDLVLFCRIQPKSREDAFVEVVDDVLKIRITAPPVDGKANKHLIKFLSRQFKAPQGNIEIESGASSKNKRVRIRAPGRLPPELNLADTP